MFKYFILFIFWTVSYSSNIEYDFAVTTQIALDYITVTDNQGNGKWELEIHTVKNKQKDVKTSHWTATASHTLTSEDNKTFLRGQVSLFTIKPDLKLVDKNLGSIKNIKLFIKEVDHDQDNNYYYSFISENGYDKCEIKKNDALADISFLVKEKSILLEIKDIWIKEEVKLEPSCFDSQPRNNQSFYDINFRNNTSNPTTIHIFAECDNIGIYDFSDNELHGGRIVKLRPGKTETLQVLEADWKQLKFTFSNNLTSMKDGLYKKIEMKKIKKKKRYDIVINKELVKEFFGSREIFSIADNFGNLEKNEISYILDKSLQKPKKDNEFSIKNNKVSFPTGNIDKIRHLSINGYPAIIDEQNKSIEKADDPILIIVDLNFVEPNKKQNKDFRDAIRAIYTQTHNSKYHLYKYLNKFPFKDDKDFIFKSSEFKANLGLSKIYMLDFDNSNPEINPSSKDLKIHSKFPFIDQKNWSSFQDYIDGVDILGAQRNQIHKYGVWSFEPILSSESLNKISFGTDVNENMSKSKYLKTFRNTVLNTNEGHNNILPSSSESKYSKIFYISYNEPEKKTKAVADKFGKKYTINFIKYTDYNLIFK